MSAKEVFLGMTDTSEPILPIIPDGQDKLLKRILYDIFIDTHTYGDRLELRCVATEMNSSPWSKEYGMTTVSNLFSCAP